MKTNDILRWSIIGGVLLILCVPLFVSNSLFFPFITGKNFAFRIIVEIITALWLILALSDTSVRPRKSLLLYLAVAFLVVIGIADMFGANPNKSLWSNFERMEGWVGLSHLVLFFTVLFSTFNAEKYWKILWNTAIGVSVLQALYGVGQLFGWFAIHQGGVRLDGTFGNATYLSIYMLFSFFMTALALTWWGQWQKGERWLSATYAVSMVLQVIMIFYTATRGTILGLIGGLFVSGAVFLLFGKERPQLRKFGIGAVIALLVLWGGFIGIRNSAVVQNNEVLSRLGGIVTPSGLVSEGSTRFAIWEMAWKGFLERPVLGWGQEDFNFVFNKYYHASLYNQEPWFDRAHNEFIDWLIAGGATGFLLYIAFFGLALYYLWRPKSPFSFTERGLFTGLLAGYAINNLVVFDNLLSYIYFFIILAYLAWRSRSVSNEGAEAGAGIIGGWNTPVTGQSSAIAAAVIVIVTAGTLYFVNVPGIAAASDLIQGLSQHSEGIIANLEYFKKAAADAESGSLGRQEVREQLLQFAIQVKSLNAGDASFQQQVAQFASDQMGNEVTRSPNDARLRLFYGSYLRQLGQYDAARTQLEKARDLSPEKQQIYFELATLEASAGNAPEALNWAKQGFELDQSFDEARTLYAAIAIRAGQQSLASSLLLPRFKTMTPDDDSILSAYASVNDYADVVVILKERVTKAPNNAQAHVQLAAGYLQEGDKTDAIAELNTAIKLDPSFAAQGQQYIQAIQSGQLP